MGWQTIGHRQARQMLQRAVLREQPAHAYLFVGPPRIGKRTLARELAAALNCTAALPERPCHQCANCRMIGHEAHPDLIVLESENERSISTETVRETRASIEWRPYQARYKVYLIIDAEDLTEQGTNVLLKALEEPPPQVLFLLTARQQESVLPTVLSRVRIVSLEPLTVGEVSQALQEQFHDEAAQARQIASLAQGRMGWAIEARMNESLLEERKSAMARVIKLTEGRHSERLIMAGEICQGENFLESRSKCLAFLDDLRIWWRDMLLVSSQSSAEIACAEWREQLTMLSARRSRTRIVSVLREIEQAASAVERNVTPRLVLESLMLRMG